ncbi:MAG: methyltransferase [Bacteroidales bacterium]|nr:methyltransferase [Bacteroidales bacterium]
MTNNKRVLIERLNGSIELFRSLPEDILKEDIYAETGHVDSEFMYSIVKFTAEYETLLSRVMQALTHLLGCDDVDEKKKTEDKPGAKWSVEQILQNCTFSDNMLFPPKVRLNKKSYSEAKKWIEEGGGKWNTQKQGFTFDFDAGRVCGILMQGKRCNLAQEFQYFATPDTVADRVCAKFSSLSSDMTILEPSAGRGSLVRAIRRRCPDAMVDCYELMPENKEFLIKEEGVVLKGDNFEECKDSYQRIIANPPFNKNQDIKHVLRMYDLLEPGGEMSVVMSRHWQIAHEKTCTDFRTWLASVDAVVEDIDEGEFKESGTSIATALVYIKKQ